MRADGLLPTDCLFDVLAACYCRMAQLMRTYAYICWPVKVRGCLRGGGSGAARRWQAPSAVWRARQCAIVLSSLSTRAHIAAVPRGTCCSTLSAAGPAMLQGAQPIMSGKHRLSRSSSAEPTKLLAAIKKSLPTQLPPLDSHTIAKLKVGV